VLRVKRSALFPEVQAAYKREALKWHPDRNPAPHARERFIAATAAYDLLKKAYEP
jgi:DnaJ-class molecular chaperone